MALVTANIAITSVAIFFIRNHYDILILSQSDIDQFPAGVLAGVDNIICTINRGESGGGDVVIDITGFTYAAGESPPETESWVTQFTIISGNLGAGGYFPLTSIKIIVDSPPKYSQSIQQAIKIDSGVQFITQNIAIISGDWQTIRQDVAVVNFLETIRQDITVTNLPDPLVINIAKGERLLI